MTRTAAPPPRPLEPDGPRPVSKFEFNLLRILRFFFGEFPADQGLQLVRASVARPDCLSPAAVHFIKDTLAKASVLFLVREGGWRNDRYLRQNTPTGGRVWDRIPLDERTLEFSGHVVEFLLWTTAEKAHETKTPWDAPAKELTPADEFFFWRAFDACRADPDLVAVLRRKAAFKKNPLSWISFPGELGGEADEPAVPDFRPLFTGLPAVLLECLQPHLAGRWIRSERAKGQIGDWKKMRQQGRAEFAALVAFLEAADRAKRTDLARFVLKTNAAIFQTDLTPVFWTGGLQGSGPPRLADRLDTQRSALAVPRQMEVLESWQQRARSVGYFDEDYQASQLWKHDWEAADGERVAARARAAVEMLEPLRGPGQPQPPTGESTAGETTESRPG
ncbi:MAG TPA: hypothetical protein VKE74_01540 [Gemmataceae bacterium]|nr:hypothetical protein [Gemmataceae bacterium]